MKPINEIRALFNVIKTETRRWFNTGARIDEVGQEMLDHIEYLEQQGGDYTEAISDLQTNKADKATTYTKSEVEQIKLELLNLIYAGL